MQKTAFGNPVLFLNQNAVHHRDLPGRTAKTQYRNPEPDPKGLAEADAVAGISFGCHFIRGNIDHARFALLVGQL